MSERPAEPGGLSPAAAAIIHDATNALTVVLGWIERAGQDGADRGQALQRAAGHARWARDQLRRMIGASAPAGQREPARDGAGAIARRTIDDLAVEAERAGVVLDAAVAEDTSSRSLPAATAAWQVLTNLLLNAIAASAPGGRVGLQVAGAGAFVRFTVKDEGPGIAADKRERLFRGGASGRVGGAGLGLRHAHDLAAENGGTLALIDSDKGACFALLWPASQPGARDLSGLRVLLLEDDSSVIELLELSLSARGADLTVVRTAEGIDQALRGQAYDVALIDLSPLAPAGEIGPALGRIVQLGRARQPDMAVVAISGSVSNAPAPDLLWLRKPFSPSELTDAILRARQAPAAGDDSTGEP